MYEKNGHVPKFGEPINTLRSDSESVYKDHVVKEHCTRNGVEQEFTAPYTHEQVGQVERFHRSFAEKVTTLYAEAPWVPREL